MQFTQNFNAYFIVDDNTTCSQTVEMHWSQAKVFPYHSDCGYSCVLLKGSGGLYLTVMVHAVPDGLHVQH